jgi:hypothetical protein
MTDGTGTMPPVGNVDPGGRQSASTASTATGLALIAASGPGDTVASLLRLSTHPSDVVTAGLSMVSMGHISLFTAGLVLIGIGIILNIASLVVRWQNRYAEIRDCQQWCQGEIERRDLVLQTSQTDRSKGVSGQGGGGAQDPYKRTDPNG